MTDMPPLIPNPVTVDRNTAAYLPGRLPVQMDVYRRCFPIEAYVMPFVLTVAGAGLIMTAVALPIEAAARGAYWPVKFVLFTAGVGATLLWRGLKMLTGVREHFDHGCVTPAVVVSENPYLIAVYTDLSTYHGMSWPVIKIEAQPLEKARGPRPAVGDRLPTVSLYYGNARQSHWTTFKPIAAACVTDDAAQVERLLAALDAHPDTWRKLERYLPQVPRPFEPGQYNVGD
jgi:hypothetical protein